MSLVNVTQPESTRANGAIGGKISGRKKSMQTAVHQKSNLDITLDSMAHSNIQVTPN